MKLGYLIENRLSVHVRIYDRKTGRPCARQALDLYMVGFNAEYVADRMKKTGMLERIEKTGRPARFESKPPTSGS